MSLGIGAKVLELAAFPGDPAHALVLLEGDARSVLTVSAAERGALTVEPERVEIPPGRTALVDVGVVGSAAAFEGAVRFRAEPREAPLAPFERELRVRLVRGTPPPERLDLGTSQPGGLATRSLDLGPVSFELGELRDAAGHAIACVASGSSILASVPGNAPAGRYEGTLVARCGQGTRRASVTLDVAAGAPAKLELAASWGWTRTTFELGGAASFELRPLVRAEGGASLSPELDMRTAELAPGRYELRVFAAAALPAGRYGGEIDAHVAGQVHRIPVTLEVRR